MVERYRITDGDIEAIRRAASDGPFCECDNVPEACMCSLAMMLCEDVQDLRKMARDDRFSSELIGIWVRNWIQ